MENYKWYQKTDLDLATDFKELVYSYFEKIHVNPLLYMKIDADYHRCLIKRFPYAIYYYIENETIIITGLFHCSQNPEKIGHKLQKRKNTS
jgi:hypothetical protein